MVRLKFHLSLFFKEFLLFVLAMYLGVLSAYKIFTSGIVTIQPAKFNPNDLVILGIFVTIFFLIRKRKKFVSLTYKIFLALIILVGSQIIFSAYVASPFDVMLPLVLLAVFYTYKNVLIHNIAIIMGIVGVAMVLGLSIAPKTGVILLVLLSFYDIISVYKTKHMVYMAKSMIESGAIFGFIVPSKMSDFLAGNNEARSKVGTEFMILGSGDIGLPLVMVCSLVQVSLSASIITAIFSLLGLFVTHLIFINQKERKPMAALPPIATMTIIGYLIAIVTKNF